MAATHSPPPAGAFVSNVSYFGYANGTAQGGSPRARVATYKACWMNGCDESDILAAFDKAIHDRVDVLSLSLGGMPWMYFEDSLAIGSFHAVMKGITVVCSAGNDGPFPGTVTNVAPWILTVGASTVDREFPSRRCMVGSLDPKKVKGKIVVCLLGMNDRIQKGLVVKNAGGVGMVLAKR
ncbi:putative tripeptidyl-peptidase II [Dioscorea sansibarensis]